MLFCIFVEVLGPVVAPWAEPAVGKSGAADRAFLDLSYRLADFSALSVRRFFAFLQPRRIEAQHEILRQSVAVFELLAEVRQGAACGNGLGLAFPSLPVYFVVEGEYWSGVSIFVFHRFYFLAGVCFI